MAKNKKKEKETIIKRKIDHIKICLTENVKAERNWWDDVILVHQALPELNKADISTEINFLNKRLNYPILIAAMSGGHFKSKVLNENCAKVAAELKIGFCVGSQRTMLENSNCLNSYSVVKKYNIPLVMANIGAAQLIKQKDRPGFKIDELKKAMDAIGADVLTIFLNFPQELIQPEGDSNFKGILKVIKNLTKNFIINVKECGAGISKETAYLLKDAGVASIEVSGISGTSWTAVESHRARNFNNLKKENLGKLFWNWGIPSPVSIKECKLGKKVKIIGSGGIRTGLDIAKAIALGADAASLATALLPYAIKSSYLLLDKMKTIIEELKTAMLLTGSKDIKELQKANYVLKGDTYNWLYQRLGKV